MLENETISKNFKEILQKYGEDISVVNYDKLEIPNKPASRTVRRRFGSWVKAKREVLSKDVIKPKSNICETNYKTEKFKADSRLAFLPDAHLIPKLGPHESYLVAKEFVKDMQPEIIIIGGDLVEMDSLSYFTKNKLLLLEGQRYQDDVDMGKKELEDIRNSCPKSRMVFLKGNHELRVDRYIEEVPTLVGKLDIRKDLGIDDFGIEWVEYNDVIPIGGMNYIHGWFWNMYHARKTLQTMGDNVMYGHVHEFQVYIQNVRMKQMPHIAISCGCLTSVNPEYVRGKPTRFVNGFGFVEYRSDGSFQPSHISIVNGEMTYGGRTWKVTKI